MTSSSSLSERIEGKAFLRILREFVANSGIFPLFNVLRELTSRGALTVVTDPANYAMLLAGAVQAIILGRSEHPWWRRAALNLLAPALYSVVDMVLEGPGKFFSTPYHAVYWIYAALMALLYMAESLLPSLRGLLAILVNIMRTLLFPVSYALSELGQELNATLSPASFLSYWSSSSGHTFILLAAVLFGLLLGLADSQISRYTRFLRKVATRLKEVSEWALDSNLLEESVESNAALEQRRAERAVFFMDIRGFTAWSEPRSPASVIQMLNQFYEAAERIILESGGHKPHFIGDEVMTWFDDPSSAVECAHRLSREANTLLGSFGLAAGGGIHLGEVVEGLMGSSRTRSYDIIGDTVNTAARLCSAAQPGEVLLSEALAERAMLIPALGSPREIQAKGKQEMLRVYPLVSQGSG